MKTILKKVGVFLGLSITLVVFLILLSNYTVRKHSNFKISKDISYAFFGHSHSECAYNDALITNSKNLSSSGESYFYTFQKVKKTLSDNPQIKTIFVEFTNNHVDSIMDSWIWGYEKMSFYLPKWGPFLDSEDYNVLLSNNSKDLLSCFSISTRKNLYRVASRDFYLGDEIGNYLDKRGSKVNSMIAENKFNRTVSKKLSISKTNLNYLRKIIEACKSKNINIFLIRSPQHDKYGDLINEYVYKRVYENRFSDVRLLDFNKLYFPNEQYIDLHHLNYEGATKYSLFFNQILENKILEKKNSVNLIDSLIRKFNINPCK